MNLELRSSEFSREHFSYSLAFMNVIASRFDHDIREYES